MTYDELLRLRDQDLPQLVDGITSTAWRIVTASQIRDALTELLKLKESHQVYVEAASPWERGDL